MTRCQDKSCGRCIQFSFLSPFLPSSVMDHAQQKHMGKRKLARPFDMSRYRLRRVALKLCYLGWNRHGLVLQEDNDNTIEAHLFHALHKTRLITDRTTAHYSRSGRTDKGVSALGQVVALYLRSNLREGFGIVEEGTEEQVIEEEGDEEKEGEEGKDPTHRRRPRMKMAPCQLTLEDQNEVDYVKTLNSALPQDIRVIGWSPVPKGFSARFDCCHRTYKYFFVRRDLDIDKMRVAAQKLVGTHDFRNFCKMDVVHVDHFERTILSFDVQSVEFLQSPDPRLQVWHFTIQGTAFLWHQVRYMVAVLFMVGRGEEDPDVMDALLDVNRVRRKPQYLMASEEPLILWESTYDELHFSGSNEALFHAHDLFGEMLSSFLIRATMTAYVQKALSSSFPREWDSNRSRTKHHPLLRRATEDSFEERVQNLSVRKQAKRKRENAS